MILVVDDDGAVSKVVSKALKSKGFKVDTAKDGVTAYEKLKKHRYKCMVLDMIMPRISGAELLLLMQMDEMSVPTVIITAFQDYSADELREFTNVVKVVHKPFMVDDIINAVNMCVGNPKDGK